MAPSSPATTGCTASDSRPSFATLIRPGRKAVSKTLSAECDDACREKQTSLPLTRKTFLKPCRPTTRHPENALTTKPRPRSFSSTCCTSNVNPPPGLRRDDEVEEGGFQLRPLRRGSLVLESVPLHSPSPRRRSGPSQFSRALS